jgi:hypothetical protein
MACTQYAVGVGVAACAITASDSRNTVQSVRSRVVERSYSTRRGSPVELLATLPPPHARPGPRGTVKGELMALGRRPQEALYKLYVLVYGTSSNPESSVNRGVCGRTHCRSPGVVLHQCHHLNSLAVCVHRHGDRAKGKRDAACASSSSACTSTLLARARAL